MSINSILDTLIATGNADQATLDALLAQLRSITLQSDDLALTPAPEYDEQTGEWTLIQDTANAQSVYEGINRLPGNTTCSQLEIVSVISHQNPASGAPARKRAPASELDPTPSFVDVASVQALDEQELNAFHIRSGGAFEIKVRLTQCSLCENYADDLQTGLGAKTYIGGGGGTDLSFAHLIPPGSHGSYESSNGRTGGLQVAWTQTKTPF